MLFMAGNAPDACQAKNRHAFRDNPAMSTKLWAILLVSFIASGVMADQGTSEKPEWGKLFTRFETTGTLVVVDERQTPATTLVFNPERASRRYAPASTFKIPHTLFALDAGFVADEFQVFRWDGVKRSFEGHNQDQTLRSAMRNSTLWVFQGFASQIGETRARSYLQAANYGNADPSTSNGDYWVDGNLKISAVEQVAFLRKLFHNTLPFKVEHQRLVKDLIIRQATTDWILRAKSGWEGSFGWWVGWVELEEGAVFFALNMDTPGRLKDLHKREKIVRSVLESMGLLDTR